MMNVVMLRVTVVNVVMLSVTKLNVVMLSVIMLSIVAPYRILGRQYPSSTVLVHHC
jgi:hypothetical protein